MWDRDLHIDYYINGNEYRETVGETEGHGRWFSWKIGDRLYAKVNLIIMVLSPIFVIKQLMEDNPSTVFILLNL